VAYAARKEFPQTAAGFVELGFGVSDRAAEEAGDFFVFVTFDVELHKHRATAGGESRQRCINGNTIQELRSKRNVQMSRVTPILEIRKPFPATHRLAKVHQDMIRSQSI